MLTKHKTSHPVPLFVCWGIMNQKNSPKKKKKRGIRSDFLEKIDGNGEKK